MCLENEEGYPEECLDNKEGYEREEHNDESGCIQSKHHVDGSGYENLELNKDGSGILGEPHDEDARENYDNYDDIKEVDGDAKHEEGGIYY